MPAIRWNKLVAQERVKALLGRAFETGALGHAYLFCGERGVGKFAAAVDLSMALLCRGGDAGAARPCGECPSCKKALSYSHPDFHVIMPLCLDSGHKGEGGALSEEGWAYAAASASARINDPYSLPRYDGVPNIPVDWVREANHAVMRGAVEGAGGAVIIDGVDSMRKESANAMLKTLEEPPQGTLMLLLTDRVHAVLPTILSRCQVVRFPLLPPDVIAGELRGRFGAGNDPAGFQAAAASGSLGLAISEYENPLDEYYGCAASLWRDCLGGDWAAAAAAADSLSAGKDSYALCRGTVSCLVRLIRIAFLKKFWQGATPINYIDLGLPDVIELPGGPGEAEAVVRLAQRTLSDLDAFGNAALVMAGFVCSLMETLNVKEQ